MTENPQVLMSKAGVHMEGTRAYVSLEKIVPHPLFHVRDPSAAKISELAENIRTIGRVINAVQCRPCKDDLERFELLSGWRRYHAVKQLGWPEIPVDLVDVDDRAAMLMILSENFSRKDLTPIEEAKQFQIARNSGLDEEDIASALKPAKSVPYVSNRLRLLKLAPKVQDLIHEGKVSPGHAEHGLLRLLEYPERQIFWANCVAKQGIAVSDLAFRVNNVLAEEKEKAEIERRLQTAKFKKCPTCGRPPTNLYSHQWKSDFKDRPLFQCEGYHSWDPMEGLEKREAYRTESAQDKVNRVMRWPLDLEKLNEKLLGFALKKAVGEKATITLAGKFPREVIEVLKETHAVDIIVLNGVELSVGRQGSSISLWTHGRWGPGSITFTMEPHAYRSGEKTCIHIDNWSNNQKTIDREKAKVKKLLQSIGADA